MAQGKDIPVVPIASADVQVSMLTALLERARTDTEGMVMVQRDHLVDALQRIQADHRRELAELPQVAERLMACFGVTA